MTSLASSLAAVAPFAAGYALLLCAPGPNLVLVLDAASSGERRACLAAAIGAASGATCLALSVAFALSSVSIPPAALAGAQLAFACWVAALGVRAIGAGLAPATGPSPRGRRFRIGFATAIANPLTASFFAAAFLSDGGSGASRLAYCATVFLAATAWFGGVAMTASAIAAAAPARLASGHARYLAGGCLIACGAIVAVRALAALV